jgi:alpha-beta hydrolase superfamily lysophospholipase
MTKRKLGWIFLLLFILMNVIAFQHAYTFTHFSDTVEVRTQDPKDLSVLAKLKILFTGIDNPRPEAKVHPDIPYKTIRIISTHELECWRMEEPRAKGVIIMFHGYAGEKSSLLARAKEFRKLGYSTVLVDFMGSGGSTGDGTSIGYTEAIQVKDCFEYITMQTKNVILFGTSMGAAAILKAMDDYHLPASSVILECPFGSLYKTVCARFRLMHVPAVPMAPLLCFWGGVQNGYWAFSHNPSAYAKSVSCPVLLLFGENDDRVTREETDSIFANLKGKKQLKVYMGIGHNIFTKPNEAQWVKDVASFLNTAQP